MLSLIQQMANVLFFSADRQTTDIHTYIQTDRQTERQTERQTTDRQTDNRQTDRQTCKTLLDTGHEALEEVRSWEVNRSDQLPVLICANSG